MLLRHGGEVAMGLVDSVRRNAAFLAVMLAITITAVALVIATASLVMRL
jgi:hypothetical protein